MAHYCKSPWMSLFVHDDGKVKSCCAGQWDWGDLKTQTLEEILNNPEVVKLRQDILDGIPNSYCSYCAGCEKTSGSSQRAYYIQPDKFHTPESILNDPNAFQLGMIDIRWNNLCQLSCVYCHEMCSTSWAKLKGYPITSIKSNYYSSVIDRVVKDKDNIEAMIMGGGEPLLHKQNVELLQSLNDELPIDIMTNLAMKLDSTSVFTELKNKRNVNWCVSIENVGDRCEYVRHGSSFSQIRENIETILSIPTHTMMLFGTYNIHSATRLQELYALANELKVVVNWQPLITPEELCVNNFSKPVRDLCIEHIEKLFESDEFKQYSTIHDEFTIERSKTFLTHVADQLRAGTKAVTIEYIDYLFREKCRVFETKYKNPNVKTFSELWPELDAIILKGQ